MRWTFGGWTNATLGRMNKTLGWMNETFGWFCRWPTNYRLSWCSLWLSQALARRRAAKAHARCGRVNLHKKTWWTHQLDGKERKNNENHSLICWVFCILCFEIIHVIVFETLLRCWVLELSTYYQQCFRSFHKFSNHHLVGELFVASFAEIDGIDKVFILQDLPSPDAESENWSSDPQWLLKKTYGRFQKLGVPPNHQF